MIRRCWLAVAGPTLALAAGCGSLMLAAQEGDPVWLLHRLDWTVYQPSHRVAIATLEVLKAELAEVKIVADEQTRDDHYNTADGKMPRPGDVRIPDDYPAYWLDGIEDQPVLVNCRLCVFEGKTRSGQKVDAVVRLEIAGSDQRTVVSVQVGRKRDDKATKELIDKISSKVHQPSYAFGSPEERMVLNAAFAPRRGTDDRKVLIAGEVRSRK